MTLAPGRSQLARVLEPEVMDSPGEARDYDAMDHSEVNRRFVADFLTAVRGAAIADDVPVLDLGTGTAQIPIALCAENPQAQVIAIDMAEAMLRLARRNVAARGFHARIILQRMDAKQLPYPTGHFAAVMSNSIVHHIPQPKLALAEALRVLRPGGLIFVRDLARPCDESQVERLVATYAADANARQRQLFDASLRAALSVEEIQAIVVQLGFDGQSAAATSDRHWTWSGRMTGN